MTTDNTVTFSVNDVVREYSEKDFEQARKEPRLDVFFEFKIASATLTQAKKGYLQVSMMVNALAADGSTMFAKYINPALPVSFKGNSPGEWAPSIWASTMRALLSEHSPYDTIETDAVTNKKVYLKNGAPIAGKAYEAATKAQSAAIRDLLDTLTGADDDARAQALASLVGRTFFGKVTPSKDGKYSNVTTIIGSKPSKDPVAYSRAEAFGG